MPLIVVHIDPLDRWSTFVACVGSGARGVPERWWRELPDVVGPLDAAGGAPIAVDTDPVACAVACVLAFGAPDAAAELPAGLLPIWALERVEAHGLHLVDDPTRFAPFELLRARAECVELWDWDGHALAWRTLAPGWHALADGSSGFDIAARQLVDQLAMLPRPTPTIEASSRDVWGRWLDAIRAARAEAHETPTDATLVALGRNGLIRYDVATSPSLDSAQWRRVDLSPAIV